MTENTTPRMHVHVIEHRYDIGDRSIFVSVPESVPIHEIAAYMQYKAEEWFGESVGLENTGVAEALVRFYGCLAAEPPKRNIAQKRIVDMYWVREDMAGDEYRRVVDGDLHPRDGLREFLSTRYWK